MIHDVYRVAGMLYRISAVGTVRLYFPTTRNWRGCHAQERNVRKAGSLVAKNVVFK